MVTIGQAKQHLLQQQQQVAMQVKQIEATKLPTITRRELARATPQTQARYKAELPKRKAALKKAKKEAIIKVQEFEEKQLGGYGKEIQKAEVKQKVLITKAAIRAKEEARRESKRRYREPTVFLSPENIAALEKAIAEKGYIEPELRKALERTYVLPEDIGVGRVEQVQVSEFKDGLPEVFQYQPSEFEKAMGKTFQGVPLISTIEGVRPTYEIKRPKVFRAPKIPIIPEFPKRVTVTTVPTFEVPEGIRLTREVEGLGERQIMIKKGEEPYIIPTYEEYREAFPLTIEKRPAITIKEKLSSLKRGLVEVFVGGSPWAEKIKEKYGSKDYQKWRKEGQERVDEFIKDVEVLERDYQRGEITGGELKIKLDKTKIDFEKDFKVGKKFLEGVSIEDISRTYKTMGYAIAPIPGVGVGLGTGALFVGKLGEIEKERVELGKAELGFKEIGMAGAKALATGIAMGVGWKIAGLTGKAGQAILGGKLALLGARPGITVGGRAGLALTGGLIRGAGTVAKREIATYFGAGLAGEAYKGIRLAAERKWMPAAYAGTTLAGGVIGFGIGGKVGERVFKAGAALTGRYVPTRPEFFLRETPKDVLVRELALREKIALARRGPLQPTEAHLVPRMDVWKGGKGFKQIFFRGDLPLKGALPGEVVSPLPLFTKLSYHFILRTQIKLIY